MRRAEGAEQRCHVAIPRGLPAKPRPAIRVEPFLRQQRDAPLDLLDRVGLDRHAKPERRTTVESGPGPEDASTGLPQFAATSKTPLCETNPDA